MGVSPDRTSWLRRAVTSMLISLASLSLVLSCLVGSREATGIRATPGEGKTGVDQVSLTWHRLILEVPS